MIEVILSRPIQVIVNRADAPDRPSIVTRSTCLADDDVAIRDHIPVLSLARSVLAVAPRLDEEPLERLLREGEESRACAGRPR